MTTKPKNQCPNCWGYQEYNKKQITPIKHKKKPQQQYKNT